jgi:hypothetical protein
MDARQLPARHGLLWLIGGFELFRRNPPLMTLLTFAYLFSVVLISLIPQIGTLLLPLLLPTLTVMLGNGCRALANGTPVANRVGELLTEGMSQHRIGLIRLGGIHLLGSLLVTIATMGLGEKIDVTDGLSPEEAVELSTNMALTLLLASPLIMAFWFAPLLTAWDGVSPGKSVFFSFVASWRNWRAFAMYGLVLSVGGIMLPGFIMVVAGMISPALLAVVSTVLRMAMIFMLAPTLVASVYLSYRDVFAPVVPEALPVIDELIDE